MLNLNDLRLFVQVADRGGFSAAARALGLPKSSISRRIIELESRLGARLINRTSRSFSITDAGAALYRHAAAMLIEAEAAETAVRSRAVAPSGTVRLTCSPATGHAGLNRVLARFAAANPAVRVVQQVTNRRVDLAEEGFDVAVRAHGDLPDSGMIRRALGRSPRWLLAAPVYLQRDGAPGDAEDLSGRDAVCISASEDPGSWTLRHVSGEVRAVSVVPRLCSDDAQAVKTAAEQGLGIAVLPAGLCRHELASGALVRVLPEWTAGDAGISLLTPSRRGQLPAVRALLDFIATELPGEMMLE